jgi:hypothetical protein
VQQSLAAVVRSIDPDLPMANVRTMDQIIDQRMASDRFNSALFGAFALVALLLAAFGIYGVMSFIVAQRTHEIGLRMALGAGRRRVVRDVIREGMVTALIGIVAGPTGSAARCRACGMTSARWIPLPSPLSRSRSWHRRCWPASSPPAAPHRSIRWRPCDRNRVADRHADGSPTNITDNACHGRTQIRRVTDSPGSTRIQAWSWQSVMIGVADGLVGRALRSGTSVRRFANLCIRSWPNLQHWPGCQE